MLLVVFVHKFVNLFVVPQYELTGWVGRLCPFYSVSPPTYLIFISQGLTHVYGLLKYNYNVTPTLHWICAALCITLSLASAYASVIIRQFAFWSGCRRCDLIC